MVCVDAPSPFPGSLEQVYDALRTHMRELDGDVVEEFTKSQVSLGEEFRTRRAFLLPAVGPTMAS